MGPRPVDLTKSAAPGEGRSTYTHEAEERNKKNFFEINVGFKIIKIYFLSSASYNLSGCGLPLPGDIKQMLD